MRGKFGGTVYKNAQGLWVGVLELKPEGQKRRRRVFRNKSRSVVENKIKDAIRRKDDNGGDLPSRDMTVAKWLDEYFDTIALKRLRPKTAKTYRGLIDNHIKPTVGKIKLERLAASDVRQMHSDIVARGKSPTTALHCHRILAVAMRYAVADGHVSRNIVNFVDAPRKATPDLEALSLEEGIRVLEEAASPDDPLGSLWAAVLLTGARQGELLGLELSRVTDTIDISLQLQRLSWEHGCGRKKDDAWPCGRKRGFECTARKVTSPTDWNGRHLEGGLWLAPPKTKKAIRTIPLVDPLRSILERYIASRAGTPNPHGLVWHNDDGSPIDPKVESEAWHALLARAGVPDVRLHDGRHTTVDLLLEAGVDEDLVQDIVGHSTVVTTRGYKSKGINKRLIAAMQKFSAQFIRPDLEDPDTPLGIAS